MKRQCSNSWAVIGLGFGDEGKGVAVNSLAQSLPAPIVVRYSGGQQAGHTVMLKNGTKHIFSNFGSGSFQRVPTYWSKYCSFDPVGTANELRILLDKGVKPVLYLDRRAPVTTVFDKECNQTNNAYRINGTCGVGVGATFQREQDLYSFTAGDLEYVSVMMTKLDLIRKYYQSSLIRGQNMEFLKAIKTLQEYDGFKLVDDLPTGYANYIFEGSQGLLLDQHTGFFPHVTRSNVGTKNILEMGFEPEVLLMTRAFQTRHGNGPMTNLEYPLRVEENPHEINIMHKWQGEFRRSVLDVGLLKYGMQKDEYIRTTSKKQLVVTCMDLVHSPYQYTDQQGKLINSVGESVFVKRVADELGIAKQQYTDSPDAIVSVAQH